jgi:plasmid replication initiation protein
MSKRAARDQEFDLFIPRMNSLPLKDQREMMERPFFSLQKRKRLKPIEYTSTDGDVWVHVSANPLFGIATIWDADILIWATSRLNQERERGANDLTPTLHTTAHELLKAIRRDTGGKSYKELEAALQRLQDEWTMDVDPESGTVRGLTITLSKWVFDGLMGDKTLLTLHPDYFTLQGGLERAIYRIARKHAGDQPKGWTCRVSILHEKSGSDSPLKQFNYLMKKMVEANALPDYQLSFVTTADNASAIHFIRKGAAERAQLKADLDAESARRAQIAREDARAAEVDGLIERRRIRNSGDE